MACGAAVEGSSERRPTWRRLGDGRGAVAWGEETGEGGRGVAAFTAHGGGMGAGGRAAELFESLCSATKNR